MSVDSDRMLKLENEVKELKNHMNKLVGAANKKSGDLIESLNKSVGQISVQLKAGNDEHETKIKELKKQLSESQSVNKKESNPKLEGEVKELKVYIGKVFGEVNAKYIDSIEAIKKSLGQINVRNEFESSENKWEIKKLAKQLSAGLATKKEPSQNLEGEIKELKNHVKKSIGEVKLNSNKSISALKKSVDNIIIVSKASSSKYEVEFKEFKKQLAAAQSANEKIKKEFNASIELFYKKYNSSLDVNKKMLGDIKSDIKQLNESAESQTARAISNFKNEFSKPMILINKEIANMKLASKKSLSEMQSSLEGCSRDNAKQVTGIAASNKLFLKQVECKLKELPAPIEMPVIDMKSEIESIVDETYITNLYRNK